MKRDADPRVIQFHTRRFKGLESDGPMLQRASGNSGFVAHLTACTQGATGWDWSFRLVRPGPGWAFVNDGKLTLFVDEPGQYVPAEAKPGETVALRLPRARENLHPHRFSLYGGQGGCVVGQGFAKFFLPVTREVAPALVECFSSKGADQLRFSMYLPNSPLDFERADAAVIDVGPHDELGVLQLLESFLRQYPQALRTTVLPYSALPGPLTLARTQGRERADLADGYGWRVCTDAVSGF